MKTFVDAMLVLFAFPGAGFSIGTHRGVLAIPCLLVGIYCYIQLDRRVSR